MDVGKHLGKDRGMYGMCHSRSRHRARWDDTHDLNAWEDAVPGPRRYRDWQDLERASERGAVAVAPRPPSERVTDTDRERAAALLSEAFRDGVLRVEEFDERLSDAYAATTVADLDAVTRDLPTEWVARVREGEQAQDRRRRHEREWRAGFRAYRGVMTVLVGIWVLTYLAAGGGLFEMPADPPSFWPIWPMLGWGIPLLLSRPRRRGADSVPAPPMVR